jgi:putative endonuclease
LLQWRKLIFLLRNRLKRFGTRQRLAPHLQLGRQGELAAERFLRKQSFKILYRNFRARNGGEIDLVCRDRKEQVLVFVEVKTRKTDFFAPPRDAVNFRKQHQITKAAKEWLRLLDYQEIPFRFDIVEVVTEPKFEIRLIRNAFQLEDNLQV